MTILITLRYKDQTVLGCDSQSQYDGGYVFYSDRDKWIRTSGGLMVATAGAHTLGNLLDDIQPEGDPHALAKTLWYLARDEQWKLAGESPPVYETDGLVVDKDGSVLEMTGDRFAYEPEPVNGLQIGVAGTGRHVAYGAILGITLWEGGLIEDDLPNACMDALRAACVSLDSCGGTLRVHVLKPASNEIDHTLIYDSERQGLADRILRRKDPE